MITKETTIETISIETDGMVILRERVAIIEDGEEIQHSYEHRHILSTDDIAEETERVQQICKAARD